MNVRFFFPPPFTGEGDRVAVEGADARRRPLRLATLDTSPARGGGKVRK
jgi:hypothetical protein